MHKIGVIHVNTVIRQRAFSKRCINLWNNLPESVVNAPDISDIKGGFNAAIQDLCIGGGLLVGGLLCVGRTTLHRC